MSIENVQEETNNESEVPKRGRGRSVAQMTAKAADNLRTDTNQRIKFKRDTGNRVISADLELNLSVPDGTVPDGHTGLWVLDTGKGEVEQKLREWWGHVTDDQGINITRPSGSRTMYLMAIENEYKKEIDDLRLKRYYDSIGENDRAGLNVDGVESYTPNGERNKIKITSDPFA